MFIGCEFSENLWKGLYDQNWKTVLDEFQKKKNKKTYLTYYSFFIFPYMWSSKILLYSSCQTNNEG